MCVCDLLLLLFIYLGGGGGGVRTHLARLVDILIL